MSAIYSDKITRNKITDIIMGWNSILNQGSLYESGFVRIVPEQNHVSKKVNACAIKVF